MAIILILSTEAASAVNDGTSGDPVMAAINDAGGTLHAMPAFSSDEPGARTFLVEATDPLSLSETLRRLPGVEACYIKPQDELP